MSRPLDGKALYRKDLPIGNMAEPAILEGGVCDAKVPLHLPAHSHAGFELHALANGSMNVQLPEGVRLEARGGDVMLVQPGAIHHGDHDMVLGSQHFWLVFDPMAPKSTAFTSEEAASISMLFQKAGNGVHAINFRPFIRDMFQRMKAHDRGIPLAEASIRSACLDFVIRVAQNLEQQRQPKQLSAAIIASIQRMRDSLSQPLSIEVIASEVGLSASAFYERFLKETGETPAAYYLHMRCQFAAQALRHDVKRSLKSIAHETGFSDQRYFATCFKRLFGCSPSAFRMNKRTIF